MIRNLTIYFLVTITLLANDIVIIKNVSTPGLTKEEIVKVYTGKLISVQDVTVIPINSQKKEILDQFLEQYLDMDENKYVAYWTVRQYIGKGVAPRVLFYK